MSSQLTLSDSFDCQLTALEKRFAVKSEYRGLLVWTPIFRRILERLRTRDQKVQMELMQMEHEIRADNARALARLEKIKSMLAMVCLGLTLVGVCASEVDDDRRARSARRRSCEDFLVEGVIL